MPAKDDIKKIVREALDGTASSIFINNILAIIDESADSKESLMAASDRIRSRVALFINENLAGKLFAALNAEIGKLSLVPGTRRKHVRVGFRQKVKLTYIGKVYELYTTNISEGGMNVATKESFPVGSKVEISLPVKGGSTIVINGAVVNTKSGRGLQPAGMGIQFNEVSELILAILKSIIRGSDQVAAASQRTTLSFGAKSDARS
jgi:Tfp pilus assembly protein PilZ